MRCLIHSTCCATDPLSRWLQPHPHVSSMFSSLVDKEAFSRRYVQVQRVGALLRGVLDRMHS
jgi:hypothetical protein